MSSRLKERGGGGGKVVASKPQKPLTDNIPNAAKTARRKTPIAAGKENPPALSSPARRIPAALPAVRWSMSSIPRGKSPNPSNLNPRASATLEIKDFGSRERCQQGKRGKDANLKPNLSRRSSLDVNLGKFGGGDRIDGVDSRASEALAPKSTVKTCKDRDFSVCDAIKVSDVKSEENESEKPIDNAVKLKALPGSSKVDEKSLGCIKVFENSSGNDAEAVNKYPSKLHEKLAVLEGRVQRIASDIKRTKEILDISNNQKESKLIILDIQEKISRIENTVSSVMDGDGAELILSEIVNDNSSHAELTGKVSNGKGLDLKELEARFFPHRKLIKNRSALDCKPGMSKPKGSMSPIDENPIALEFLASLNTDQHDLKKDGNLKSERTGIRELGMEGTMSGDNFESRKVASWQFNEEVALMASEKLENLDDQENKPGMMVLEEAEDSFKSQIFEIGRKSSTGGWFVSEGEAVLLSHNDGSCSYYDIANYEVWKPQT